MSNVTAREVAGLISDLVRIESVTPWLVPGGAGEAGVADYIAKWLADMPIQVTRQEIGPGRVNLLCTLKGSGGGPVLCVNAHLDTVGYAGWPDEALVPRLDGDRLYGLGAADDKGCCAAAMLAMRELAIGAHRLSGDLVVALVADEEGVSAGTEHLVRGLRADAAVVLEADALPRVVTEHQGFGWLDIVFKGRAAHGSVPEEGIDAIVGMADAVNRLRKLDHERFAPLADAPNGRTVFHTGTVRGGTDYATYPSEAVLGIEIGTQPGESIDDRLAEIETVLAQTRASVPGLETSVRVRLAREPFAAVGHERLLACFDQAAVSHLGTPLQPVGMNAWTDAALMQSAGIPTILLGPAGGNLHAPGEWVHIPEVVSLVDVLVTASATLLA